MKFRTIVADPPWPFPNKTLWDRPASVPDKHYEILTIDDIKKLPVQDFSEDSAFCWLWTPTHHLIRGIAYDVLEAWGFRPMTTLVWIKPQMGLGHYLRNSHEQMLLGVRGSVPLRVRDQMSYFTADRGKHSVKPDEAFDIIERHSHPEYLEMFARKEREGWTSWGLEIGDPLGIGFDPEEW